MLVTDFRMIGNKLLSVRKRSGLTQAAVAEAASISDRTYADIERGTVNMRISTFLKICDVLHVTPDEILTEDGPPTQQAIEDRFLARTSREKDTALQLLKTYLDSLNE